MTAKNFNQLPLPEGVSVNWDYVPSKATLKTQFMRMKCKPRKGRFPQWSEILGAKESQKWIVYFIYSPDGALDPGHYFTLERLVDELASVMIVCACPPNHSVLSTLGKYCDALYWKDFSGWDFSAYAIALEQIANHSSGSDVLILNDSIMGPFSSLSKLIDSAPWGLTGFTGNAQYENHIQSYAFVVKNVTRKTIDELSEVISIAWSYNDAKAVILMQETMLARIAKPTMTVGALFYSNCSQYKDLCLECPEFLLEMGFPWLKKSLIRKFRGYFYPPEKIDALLKKNKHPALLQ